ncbi:MAG: 16S rRNA (cytosine(1402)-N(4))-methyltransferase RsmH [Patescibacteria group bacterium]
MPDFAKAMSDKHKPVLLHKSIEALNLQNEKTFLDGTLGSGGHSEAVLQHFPQVRIVGLDQDSQAVERIKKKLKIETVVGNFRNLDQVLSKKNIVKVDAILFDLGISTDQLEQSGRGFTFLKDEPLDMRMSDAGVRATEILNSWDEHAIGLVLYGFGEEKFSKQIAKAIVEKRKIKPFQTTFDLVETVLTVKKRYRKDKIHPATKTFQALRIAVNEELTSLEIGLEKGFQILGPNGRFAVISFHSLEDRIVKNFFRTKIKQKLAKQITKKPIIPNIEEIKDNPRSRSAKLRVIEKI